MTEREAMEKATAVMRRQHKALNTEQVYLHWLRRYMSALRSMPAGLPSEQRLERFLTDLALQASVSASTQNQAFNAIRFFYGEVLGYPLQNVDALRATRPERVRHAPTVAETRALLDAVRDEGGYPCRLIVRLLYGCGLRVTEPLNLRMKDVDVAGGRLTLIGAKGRKDRIVALPCSLANEIESQTAFARAVWQRDAQARIPLEVPEALARKYPETEWAWPWAWLFPARWPCRHPRSGRTVRFRMHEANVQRAVKHARRQLGIMVLPHELRHAYATHTLDRGANIKALQAAMGHAQMETTAGYCHAEALSVASPLEMAI